MAIHSRILASGNRNARVLVTGILECELKPTKLLRLEELDCTAFKIESVIWVLQEKLGLRLWWGQGEIVEGHPERRADNLIFVMESRNTIRFDQGLNSPGKNEKWDRCIWVDSFNCMKHDDEPKHFTVVLEFDKQ